MSIKDRVLTTIKKPNYIYIYSVVTNNTLNTSYPQEIHKNLIYYTGGHTRVIIEPGNWYEVVRGKPTVELSGFYNYAIQIMRPPNKKTGKTELKMISEKYQDKYDLILNNLMMHSIIYDKY